MTKMEFREFVIALFGADMKGNGESDAQIASLVLPFDPQLAAMIQTLADTKLAMHKYLEARVER